MNYFTEEVGITSQVFDYLFDTGDFEIKQIEEDLDGDTFAYGFADNYVMAATTADLCKYIIYNCGEDTEISAMPMFDRDYLEGNTIEMMATDLEEAFKEVYQANRERWLEEVEG